MKYVQPIDLKKFSTSLRDAERKNLLSFKFEGEEFSVGYARYILVNAPVED